MEKSCRTLKVYSTTGKPTPKITLQGKWVEQLGFTIGDYIEITTQGNQVIITKITEPKQFPKTKYQTVLPKETISLVKEQAHHYHMEEQEVMEKALLYYFKMKGIFNK